MLVEVDHEVSRVETFPPTQSVFAAVGLEKSYGTVKALRGVNLEVGRREIVAVVGDNGAGKSTLIRVLSGLEQPDSGVLYRDGVEVSFPTVAAANQHGVVPIFQTPEACLAMDVADNIYMGHELMRGPFVDKKRMLRESKGLLDRLGSNLSPTRIVKGLSEGERQTLTFARAMLLDPEILLLDEPTSSLSVIQTSEVLDQLLSMRDQGKGIIMVCHTLPDVFAVSDRICVMRHGRVRVVLNTRDTSYEQVIGCMAGAPVA